MLRPNMLDQSYDRMAMFEIQILNGLTSRPVFIQENVCTTCAFPFHGIRDIVFITHQHYFGCTILFHTSIEFRLILLLVRIFFVSSGSLNWLCASLNHKLRLRSNCTSLNRKTVLHCTSLNRKTVLHCTPTELSCQFFALNFPIVHTFFFRINFTLVHR